MLYANVLSATLGCDHHATDYTNSSCPNKQAFMLHIIASMSSKLRFLFISFNVDSPAHNTVAGRANWERRFSQLTSTV